MRDSLPHLATGAVDRAALQTVEARFASRRERQRPAGEIEERLAVIWAAVLGVASINADDNFFEAGGHSLIAARMLTQGRTGIRTPHQAGHSFSRPHTAGICKSFDADGPSGIRFSAGGQNSAAWRQAAADRHQQHRHLLRPGEKTSAPNSPYTRCSCSIHRSEIPRRRVRWKKSRPVTSELIRRVQPQGPYELMGWCVAGALTFEISRQLTDAQQRVEHLFLIDSWVPGYFKRLPRIRGVIAAYSLRAQLILADWRRVMSREKSAGRSSPGAPCSSACSACSGNPMPP